MAGFFVYEATLAKEPLVRQPLFERGWLLTRLSSDPIHSGIQPNKSEWVRLRFALYMLTSPDPYPISYIQNFIGPLIMTGTLCQ